MHGWADLVEITGQNFSVPGFTPDTITHEQNPFSIGCMSGENTVDKAKGKRVFRGDIAELRYYADLLPNDQVFAIRDELVDKYVPECEQECSSLTRRGFNQADQFDETVSVTRKRRLTSVLLTANVCRRATYGSTRLGHGHRTSSTCRNWSRGAACSQASTCCRKSR